MIPARRGGVMPVLPPQNTVSSPRTRGPIRRVGRALRDSWSSSFIYLVRLWLWVPAFAGTTVLGTHPQRLPFAQGLGVARRNVGVFGILAHSRQNFPRPRAFGPDG